MLLRNAGRVLTRMQLIDRVWGADYVGDTKTLDVHVKRLRAKIEPDPAAPKYLLTVRGLGYKLEAWAPRARLPSASIFWTPRLGQTLGRPGRSARQGLEVALLRTVAGSSPVSQSAGCPATRPAGSSCPVRSCSIRSCVRS